MLHLYEIADGKIKPRKGDPSVVICMDEFGPLNLLPRPGKQWAPMAVKGEGTSNGPRRRRRRATYTRTKGVRHLMAAYDLKKDRIYGHIKTKKDRTTFLEFCRYIRTLYPAEHPHRHRDGQLQPAPVDQSRHPGLATGPKPTTSSSPTCPPTPAG